MSDVDPSTPELAAPTRSCAACAAGLLAEQDWCLECGTAAPGRLGRRMAGNGLRAAAAVVGVTTVLVSGAGAAAYAALTDEAARSTSAPVTADATPVPGQLAQVPPSQMPAAEPPVAETPEIPDAGTGGDAAVDDGLGDLPDVGDTPDIPVTDDFPIEDDTDTRSTTTTEEETDTGSEGDDTTSTTPEEEEPAPLEPLTLAKDAGALYDPYGRAVDPTDPAFALDDDAKTVFSVSAPNDGNKMQVGLVLDLGRNQTVRGVRFETTTPGFTVELYGADTSVLPPDILDTRWTNLGARKRVDLTTAGGTTKDDGEETIAFRGDGDRFRRVLLWFTVPPQDGPKIDIKRVELLG